MVYLVLLKVLFPGEVDHGTNEYAQIECPLLPLAIIFIHSFICVNYAS